MSRPELGDPLMRFGEPIKRGELDASKHLQEMKREAFRFTEPLVYKFLYAYIEGGREIEIELEWAQE